MPRSNWSVTKNWVTTQFWTWSYLLFLFYHLNLMLSMMIGLIALYKAVFAFCLFSRLLEHFRSYTHLLFYSFFLRTFHLIP